MVLLYSFAVSVLTIAGLILHLAMELSLHWNPQFYLNPIPFHLTFASAYILGINGNFLKALNLNSTHKISKAVQEEALLCKEWQIKTAMLNVPLHCSALEVLAIASWTSLPIIT